MIALAPHACAQLSFATLTIMQPVHYHNEIVTVHTAGRNEEHEDEDKLKLTVFNIGKARQCRHTGTPGVTSRPDNTN